MQIRWLLFLLLHATIELSSTENKCLDIEEVTPKKYFQLNGKSMTINLETSSRITHQLSTHIFYIYIKEVLGYSKISISHHDDNFDIESVIRRLTDYAYQSVSEPPATINLEVWASPDYDTFAKEFVKEVGSVGPPGRFGWFIPAELDFPVREYYSRYFWDDSIQEVHWSFFMDRNLVRYFDMDPETLQLIEDNAFNKNGSRDNDYICPSTICHKSMYVPQQCKTQTCAVLLAPQFNSSKFLIDQVEETGLLVKILWLGDNFPNAVSRLKSLLENRHTIRSKKSLVFFHWFPSEVVSHEKRFINIQFKNNELYNFTHKSYGYKYEMQRLVKLAWSKIEGNAQPLYIGLRHFRLTEDDYYYLLKSYEDGENITNVACNWMKANEKVWSKWKHDTKKAIVYIGGIFPMGLSAYNGKGIAMGAQIATQAINKNDSLLKDYELKLLVYDGKCQADNVMKNFIDFIVTREYYMNLVGVLGPACSETVEPIAGVSKHYHVLIISYSAEGASFSNRKKYPYFFRTIGENQHYKHVYMSLFKRFGWKRVAALTEDGQKYTEYISLMSDDLEKNGINFIANKKFPREKSTEDMKYRIMMAITSAGFILTYGSSVENRPESANAADEDAPGGRKKDIIVLDGGFATQLSCHVQQPIDGDVLWSARFLATDPEAVIDAHLDFLRAGADLIITNTYQADVQLFVKHLNMTEEEAYNLIKQSVDLARTAVERFLAEYPEARRPLIVGSVGPYGASLHDGSEYTGAYAKNTSTEIMKKWHLPRIKALVEGGCNVLALETIPCKVEAEMLVNLLKEQFPGMKAWLSFSVGQDGKTTAYGENFKEVARHCYDLNPDQLVAVGVNCTAPRLIELLISGINDGRKNNPIPLIVYPNSGESYNVELGWINRDKCEPVETYVHRWLDLGVTWVGGCCRTYAIDVTRIRREVELWKQKQNLSEESQ